MFNRTSPSPLSARTLLLLLMSILLVGSAFAQQSEPAAAPNTLSQTVRGRVLDDQSELPLPGALIRLVDAEPPKAVYADGNGRFTLTEVPVGRQSLLVTFTGYEEALLRNLVVSSGKELDLTIRLQESLQLQEEVVITADEQEGEVRNDLATVSARSFSVEEANRYAGTLSDPSRMASNFAGVANTADDRNDIVIRGNSPLGMLWRMEGMDIPNPNHFAGQGTNGGPVSMLNNNVLANSDFFTGAWPAQYGNATSGVFDLQLRNGNASSYEHMFQIGFNGLELMTEGPISRELGASYLVSYRYSTLAFFDALGLSFGELNAVPEFQDLSFKVNLPTRRAGTFSVFGMGGESNIEIVESPLESQEFEDLDPKDYTDIYQENFRGVVGLNHSIPLGTNTYLKSTVGFTFENRDLTVDSVLIDQSTLPSYVERVRNNRLTVQQMVNHKFNSQHTLRVGYFVHTFLNDFTDSTYVLQDSSFRALRQFDGTATLAQVYGQWQYRINPKWTLNAGVFGQHFFFNDTWTVEPRLGVNWRFKPNQTLSLAYGLHSQLQQMELYTYQTPEGEQLNRDLKMTRSQHLVLGYERQLPADIQLKVEGYYQYLDNVAVDASGETSFSALNIGSDFGSCPRTSTAWTTPARAATWVWS